ncbi:chemotaxis protein CheW [Phenylobacterium sp.]|uniref:chemotaxis protein CheW n=1 Tax=Phenylobacterium sp. TaxID=1871053 RepID=UPI0035B0B936
MAAPEHALPAIGSELVTVAIGGQQFAIDIMVVREIRGWTTSTPLPHAPSYVLGMINLRGAVLPVVDLGMRLGLSACVRDNSAVVVVAQIGGREVGLLVDEVCDILTVSENMLQEPPDVGADGLDDFVRGVITTDEGIVTLLTLDGVLPPAMQDAA